MKIRTGFVSNSSSCSFCIYKKVMSEEEIKEFGELINNINNSDCDTYIEEDGNYFLGTMSYHNPIISEYLEKHFTRDQYGLVW